MWDENYSTEEYIYGTEPNQFLQENYTKIPLGKILCVAEGEGRNAVFLAKQGYEVTAVDASAVGLEKAKKLAQQNNVQIEFIHADLGEYDLGEQQWDGIVSIFCHVPVPVRIALHKKIAKALKPTGLFLLEAYIPEQLKHKTGGPPTDELMMSAELVSQELEGMTFSHLQELEREIIEGTHHFGLGAVVQAIAAHS